MPLTQEQKKQYKSIGHHLKPVLTVADNGLTEGVLAELERALGDHELIKIKVNILDREARLAAIAELCKVRQSGTGSGHRQDGAAVPQERQRQQATVERPPLQVMSTRVTGALRAPCHSHPGAG
jgi:putative YhbY family RNA-binding protein